MSEPDASSAAPLPPVLAQTAADDRASGRLNAPAASVAPRRGGLKVLLVSHAFPPINVIGAVRVGKFAKYLHEAGHDVRVIAARAPGDNSLALEIPPARVHYAADRPIDAVLDKFAKRVRQLGGAAGSGAAAPLAASSLPVRGRLATALIRHYYALVRMPDGRAGWISAATAAGRDVVRDWHPDIVFASAPPNSALVAAARIARACGAPWIAELRDLWIGNPYYDEPPWRLWVDHLFEWRVLGSAAGLVTVSRGWAAALRHRHRQPVACILNGYVEEDLPDERSGPAPGDVVSILYTGNIYPGYRDPSALFQAIGLLGEERGRVAVHFYGPAEAEILPLASAHGAQDRVFLHDRVSYTASLALQASADVLLLLQWNHPKDEGNIPAKFFEYLGAGRPILMLGYEHGDLARMIRERAAGLVCNDPSAIARQLRTWVAQRTAGVPPIDPKAREGMTRADQFRKLERFLIEALPAGPARAR